MKQLLADSQYRNCNFFQLLKMIEISKRLTEIEKSIFNKRILFYAPPKTRKSYILNEFCGKLDINLFEVSIFDEHKMGKLFSNSVNLNSEFNIVFLRHVNIGYSNSGNIKQLLEKINIWIDNQNKKIMLIIGTDEFNSSLYEICHGYVEFKFGGLSLIEKLNFAEEYLKQMTFKSSIIDKDEIIYLIKSYTLEAGIAQLKNCIDRVIEYCLVNKELKASRDTIEKALGPRFYVFDNVNVDKEMGNGLAWTPYGGKVLILDTLIRDGNGKINILGNIKKTMSDSIIMAYQILHNYSEDFGISVEEMDEKDLYVSIPELGESKDGASMGLAIFFKLYCIFANKKVKKPIALSGELMMNGEVIRVGGLKEKLNSAYEHGIEDVVLPVKSNGELMRLPKPLIEQFEISLVNDVFELIHILDKKQYFS